MEEEMQEGEIDHHAYDQVNVLTITQAIVDRIVLTPVDHSPPKPTGLLSERKSVML